MKKYFFFWLQMTNHLTQIAFASRFGALFFIFGKVIRFLFFLLFLFVITSKTKSLAGFTLWQIILFFLTFNLIDTIAQFLWRDVYRFRSNIISGNFDLILSKPISPLFRSLFGGSDILDLVTFVPLVAFMIFALFKVGGITVIHVLLYILLVLNGLVIALSFHIFVLALGIITTEVDNAIWMFREITQLGRYPLRMFPKPIGIAFTYILPVAAMITFPTNALLGILSVGGVIVSFLFSSLLLGLSLYSWGNALKKYSSASS
jgi:ABC-2 type transport system permease protein